MKRSISVIIILIAVSLIAIALWRLRQQTTTPMQITSTAFEANGNIPDKFTCSGENISPELFLDRVPAETGSLALIVDDPDASRGVTFNHWLMWNIPADKKTIAEGKVPAGVIEGKNDAGKYGYMGPCPPSGKPHHYRFKLYALKEPLALGKDASIADLVEQINLYLIESAELVGIYERK